MNVVKATIRKPQGIFKDYQGIIEEISRGHTGDLPHPPIYEYPAMLKLKKLSVNHYSDTLRSSYYRILEPPLGVQFIIHSVQHLSSK